MKSYSFILFFAMQFFFPIANACNMKESDILLNVSLDDNSLMFTLVNEAKTSLSINRDFSHYQNMYIVVLREKGFGSVLDGSGVLSGDPSVGEYRLVPKQKIIEEVDLLSMYPKLNTISGSVIVFWSTELDVLIEGEEKTIRKSGSLRVVLPI